MKYLLRNVLLGVIGLVLFSCGSQTVPVEPSDGSYAVYIESPKLVIEGKKTYISYARNNEIVRSELLPDGSLTAPVGGIGLFGKNAKVQTSVIPAPAEATQVALKAMEDVSELVCTPDSVRFFFTAYSQETGKRELYWIRNGGTLPVQMSKDYWYADFSVPFGFMEMEDQFFSDGSKAYAVLCVCSNHWNPSEICCIRMDGSAQYKVLSHENELLQDSLSRSVAVGIADYTTSLDNTIHYLHYHRNDKMDKDTMAILFSSSYMSWNEETIELAQEGAQIFVVSEKDIRSDQEREEFETYIHSNFWKKP